MPRARKRQDRWAHRRGEPRVFAFLWTVFLLAVTTIGFVSVGFGGPVTLDVYRPAARILLVTTVIGITVLWPMTRLAQSLPPRGAAVGPVLRDLAVVMLPVQAVLWPQVWLAAWPRGVVTTIDGVMLAWGLLTAGWLAVAMRMVAARESGESPVASATRTGWMACGAAMVLAAPVAMALGMSGVEVTMLSPLTAIYELTRERAWTGEWGGLGEAHFWPILTVAVAGIALLGIASTGEVRRFAGKRA